MTEHTEEQTIDPALDPAEVPVPERYTEERGEKAGDAFLASIFGADPSQLRDPAAPDAPVEEPTNENTEESSDEPSPGNEGGPETVDNSSDEPDSNLRETAAFDKAAKALALSGFKAADLEVLTPERIISLGEKAAKVQADASKKLEEASLRIAELEAKAQSTAASDDAAEPESGSSRNGQPQAIADAVKALTSELDEIGVSQDVLEGFAPALSQAVADTVEARVAAALEERGVGAPQLHPEVARLLVGQSRTRLSETYPQVTKDEVWESVIEEAKGMTDLNEAGAFNSLDEALDFAAFRVLGKQVVSEHAADVRKRSQRRRQNQPSPATGSVSPSAVSIDDFATQVATLIQNGRYDEAEKLRSQRPSIR